MDIRSRRNLCTARAVGLPALKNHQTTWPNGPQGHRDVGHGSMGRWVDGAMGSCGHWDTPLRASGHGAGYIDIPNKNGNI